LTDRWHGVAPIMRGGEVLAGAPVRHDICRPAAERQHV